MARGDALYARLDVSLFHDPRFRCLTAAGKVFYLASYVTAVEARCELLPPHWTLTALADRAALDIRTSKLAYKIAVECGLLSEGPGGRIRVMGVRSNHRKLANWIDDNGFPISVPEGSLEEERTGKRDDRRERRQEKEFTGHAKPRVISL